MFTALHNFIIYVYFVLIFEFECMMVFAIINMYMKLLLYVSAFLCLALMYLYSSVKTHYIAAYSQCNILHICELIHLINILSLPLSLHYTLICTFQALFNKLISVFAHRALLIF